MLFLFIFLSEKFLSEFFSHFGSCLLHQGCEMYPRESCAEKSHIIWLYWVQWEHSKLGVGANPWVSALEGQVRPQPFPFLSCADEMFSSAPSHALAMMFYLDTGSDAPQTADWWLKNQKLNQGVFTLLKSWHFVTKWKTD